MTTRATGTFTRALLAGVVCLAILAGMLVGHAWPLWTGEVVVMDASGAVPRDLFRGQHIRLDTPASTLRVMSIGGPAARGPAMEAVPVQPSGPGWEAWEDVREAPGGVVYVQLAGESGVAVPVTVSRQPVEGALNLKGRIRSAWQTGVLHVDYGLDAFYVPEATARALEPALRAGRPVQMEVAIAADGRARIRNLIIDGTPLPR